jgi:glycosyltransferase involved in cell wall biosynthesis
MESKLSVVVRTRNEADRLRLTLTSLACQRPTQVVVVDDGSVDHTASVIEEAAGTLPLVAIRNPVSLGRCGASNAGAAAASGDILLFLDGDTLAGPQCLERHLKAHEGAPAYIARGETHHLRSTRFLLDPETGTPRPGEANRLERMPAAEREGLRLTRRQIREDFASIERRSQPGVYPGAGPRRLYELEIDALRNRPKCEVLWAATSGSNLSVRRRAFLDAGGFNEDLDNNEHRELALRLYGRGHGIGLAPGARTYHMTHRSGWRDPLVENGWEAVFYRLHPIAAVKLLSVLWASLADASPIPPNARITCLPHLARAARGETGVDYDAVRRLIPGLPALPGAVGTA